VRVITGRYRVDAALFENTVNLYSVHGIGGATGIKTTVVSQQRADAGFVNRKDRYE